MVFNRFGAVIFCLFVCISNLRFSLSLSLSLSLSHSLTLLPLLFLYCFFSAYFFAFLQLLVCFLWGFSRSSNCHSYTFPFSLSPLLSSLSFSSFSLSWEEMSSRAIFSITKEQNVRNTLGPGQKLYLCYVVYVLLLKILLSLSSLSPTSLERPNFHPS